MRVAGIVLWGIGWLVGGPWVMATALAGVRPGPWLAVGWGAAVCVVLGLAVVWCAT